jgi:hypothetical protein
MKYYFLVIEDLCNDNKIVYHSPYFHSVEELNENKEELLEEYPTARYLVRGFVSF